MNKPQPKGDVMESVLHVDPTASDRAKRLNMVALDLAIQRHEKMLKDLAASVQLMTNMVGTLQNQFDEFNRQRVLELQKLLNGGPTERGD